ncbi:MAG TPA: nitroreductase/quinone reductase family protein [Actinomycetota bacterium]|nr:nitroreductase/quinone reductase family protein [Actinomycetota bacterium]
MAAARARGPVGERQGHGSQGRLERIVGLLLQADVLAELLGRAADPSARRSGAGDRPLDLPVLFLTTKGRKSGRPRTRALMFLADGGSFVVAASNPGHGGAPAWWLNLQSDPRATVQVGGTTVPVVAERAGPEVRARLWPSIVRMNPPYEELQRRAGRELPVVVLRPVHAIAGAPSGWGPAEAAGARPGRR